MRTPASSAASRIGVAPSASSVVPVLANETVPPSPVDQDGRAEALGVQPVGDAGRRPVLLERLEHPDRPAGPGRRARADPGTSAAMAAASSIPAVSVCCSTSRIRPSAARSRSSAPKIDVVGGRRRVHQDDVGQRVVRVVAQHAHHRRDAGAGGDEQRLGRALRRAGTNSPAAWSSWMIVPGLGPVHQVVADLAARDRLDGDADAAVGAGQVGGQRVGAPLADAVDVDADPHVLARACAGASRGRAG